MSTNEDRLKMDFADPASNSSGRPSESPTNLADSPVVKDPDAALSPATRARGDLPANPGAGMAQAERLPTGGIDGEATMTRSEPGIDPGSGMNPGMGNIVGDVAGGGRLDQADIGDTPALGHEPNPQGRIGATPEHQGTTAADDETIGTDDPSALAGDRTARRL